MTKWVKRLLSLAAIGSAAAGLIYYFKKIYKGRDEDLEDDFEDDDFDLDSDLKPVGDREYVPLTPKADDAGEEAPAGEASEEPEEEAAGEEPAEEPETSEETSEETSKKTSE